MKKTKTILTFVFAISSTLTNAQTWQVGGNSTAQLGSPVNPTIGTIGNNQFNFITNNFQRMRISAGLGTSGTGFAAFGNNLGAAFVPVDRLHLYHDAASQVRMRFTHAGTGSSVTDGTALGIQANGDFRLTQFEDFNTDFFTPENLGTGVTQRMRIMSNGQVLIGNNTFAENVINGNPITNFSTAPSSLLNVRGPINSCAPFNPANPLPTILYGYAPPSGSPGAVPIDGFRMHLNYQFRAILYDALVFEKTDGTTENPNGYVAFTNTGNDGVEELSAYYDGIGRAYIGNDITTPALNRLTIESQAADASESGLRLVNLTSSDTPVTNPGTGVLSVNEDGDVIYVTGGGGAAPLAKNGLSQNVPNTIHEWGGTLIHDTEIEHAGNNIFYTQGPLPGDYRYKQYFDGQTRSLAIENGLHNIGAAAHLETIKFSNRTNDDSYGRWTELLGAATGFGTSTSLQLVGHLIDNQEASIAGITKGIFVRSQNNGSGANYAGDFHAVGAGAGVNNIAVHGRASVAAESYAGYFDGQVGITNNLTVGGTITSQGLPVLTGSDQNIKTGVSDLSNSLDIVNGLQPKSFYFDTLNTHGFTFTNKKQYGFIAQDVEQFLPELVFETVKKTEFDSLGNVSYPSYTYKALNYNAFIAILTDAVQEQQEQIQNQESNLQSKDSIIDDLNARLTRLENCLSALLPSLCELNQSAIQQNTPEAQEQLKSNLEVTLSNRNSIVLSQNVPNPFAESTVIEYNVPATVQKAQILFYDKHGKLINAVDVTERGKGELKVFASDLSSGIYTYSLVTDGKVSVTKKMVKE